MSVWVKYIGFVFLLLLLLLPFYYFSIGGNTKEWVGMEVLGKESDQGARCEILKEFIKLN